jgi:hypothetical protein
MALAAMRRMKRTALAALLSLSLCSAFAQNPGSRIGATSEVPAATRSEATQPSRQCDRLSGEKRIRCLQEEVRSPAPGTTRPGGPEATGMASGAGAAAGGRAGTSGGGSFGAAAPR